MNDIKDLVVLVADSDAEQTIEGLLSKHQRLSIRQISYKVLRHVGRDPGCWNDADNFLRAQAKLYRYALVIFDHDGCGQEDREIEALQDELETRLASNGWDDRACVVIIKPELEVWTWSDSPQVDACLGWAKRNPNLRSWLKSEGLLTDKSPKPPDPKTAMESALKTVRKQISASNFRQLAEQVSFSRCTDPAFQRLRGTLQEWFPLV